MKMTLLVAGTMLVLLGCQNPKTKPTDDNYIKTLNTYFLDHADCLLDGSVKFPFETGDPQKTKEMDALVVAQIVEAHREPAIKISRYTLTPTGTRAGTHLCYGHREVTAIVSSTPPALANTFTETQVVYRYKIEEMPVWAKTPEVMAAFPKMTQEASGNATGKATLALTGVGWSVPD